MGIATKLDVLTTGALTPDILHAENAAAKLTSRGKVVFHTNFEDGSFEGWRDHQGGNQQIPCLSLTQRRTHTGTHAAMLSTGHVPYQSGLISNTTSTYKNMSLHRAAGVLSLSGWLAHGGEASSVANATDTSFYEWGFLLDVQKWDNSTRGLYRLVFQNPSDGTQPFLAVYNDANGPVIVPSSRTAVAGENESKLNWNYMRLSVDLDANAGLGGYLEAQMNNQIFDLSGLGAGRGQTTAQKGSAMENFNGGCNAGVEINRSFTYTSLQQNLLIFDDMVMTQGDVKSA